MLIKEKKKEENSGNNQTWSTNDRIKSHVVSERILQKPKSNIYD